MLAAAAAEAADAAGEETEVAPVMKTPVVDIARPSRGAHREQDKEWAALTTWLRCAAPFYRPTPACCAFLARTTGCNMRWLLRAQPEAYASLQKRISCTKYHASNIMPLMLSYAPVLLPPSPTCVLNGVC